MKFSSLLQTEFTCSNFDRVVTRINYIDGVIPIESACELLDKHREEYFKFNKSGSKPSWRN